MRPDLPWNVAGISSEAREAARAAARREGLSVGEWLTRRIVAGLSDISEPPSRSEWHRPTEYPAEPDRHRRDSDAMLDRVSRSESETAEVYRRIEEQLRGMARRLDASERSQTESNRVMSKAAVEMNIAAREQAQAFDQLGANVSHIVERLERVEARESSDGLREAVKALHQGLSRLADQISQTANQSATQISALADNLENVAGRVGQARHDSLLATQALEARLATIDERVRELESAAQANTGLIDRAMEALEAQKRIVPPTEEAIARLESSVRRLEERSADPQIDRRLGGIERTLADVVARIEPEEEIDPVNENLQKIAQRLETLEVAQREAAAEMRKAATDRLPEEPLVPLAPAITPMLVAMASTASVGFRPLPNFEPPPAAVPDAPPPVVAPPSVVPPPFAEPPARAEAGPIDLPQSETNAGDEDNPEAVESYLAAARRSARAAAQAETERSTTIGGLRWGAKPDEDTPKRTRPLIVGIAALVGIALIAGAILSRQAATDRPPQTTTAPINKTSAKPATAATADMHTTSEDQEAAAGRTTTAPLTPAGRKSTGPAVLPSGLAATPDGPATKMAEQSPHPLQQQASIRPTTNAPLDRLTASATAGNARAQLIIGLRYLDGDGVPNNDTEAAKWLSRAAELGEPVAQYRLGTLYERGRGVTADAAKAVRWYLAAANQGSRKAMHNLAVAYAEGTGIKKDYAEASRWFLKAANLGLKDSQFNLAILYERGYGVPQNLVDAYKWYAIAAAQGDSESKARLNAIASQLDNEARAAAQHAADSFRPSALDARANVAPTVANTTHG